MHASLRFASSKSHGGAGNPFFSNFAQQHSTEYPYLPNAWGPRGYYPGMGATPLNANSFSGTFNVGIAPPDAKTSHMYKSYKERSKAGGGGMGRDDFANAENLGLASSYYYNGGLSDRDADSMKLAGLTALACLSKTESGDEERKTIMVSERSERALRKTIKRASYVTIN